ncbi:MAG: Kynurenine formamidase [Chlamydiae bacterium]|nr:Kynurenine formamidase [Chlamydiota bacterium]
MNYLKRFKIIDISQPIEKRTACFPGDTSFDFSLKASHAESGSFNLTAYQMSPHVGSHADAPAHVLPKMERGNLAGSMPLDPFIGPCMVIDLSPCCAEITLKDLEGKLDLTEVPTRILFRTRSHSRFDLFEEENACFSTTVIDFLSSHGVLLIGIDSPSVDATSSKQLEAHHALISHNMFWLENLELDGAKEGVYFLSALPLKLMELEAAPVRAVLLEFLPDRKGDSLC